MLLEKQPPSVITSLMASASDEITIIISFVLMLVAAVLLYNSFRKTNHEKMVGSQTGSLKSTMRASKSTRDKEHSLGEIHSNNSSQVRADLSGAKHVSMDARYARYHNMWVCEYCETLNADKYVTCEVCRRPMDFADWFASSQGEWLRR